METRNINGEVMDLEVAFKKNDRLIWSVVKRFTNKGRTQGLDAEDLHSIASIGFIKAFNAFDPETYPVKFSTYAVPMMIGEVQRYFRDQAGDVKFSRRVVELGNKIFRDDMVDEPFEIIALHFDVHKDQVEEAFNYIRNGRARSTEETVFKTDGDEITLGDQLGDNKLSDYTQVNVNTFLESLEARDRTIIELMMQEKTQSEIGQELGVTQVQVSRLIRKLHPVVEEYFGYPYGYFSNRKKVNDAEERLKMNAKKKKVERKVKGDLELAKKLLAETKKSPCSIAKETGINDSSAYYWAKKIRTPEVEENPVEISYIEPVKKDDVQEHIEVLKEDIHISMGVSPELVGVNAGLPEGSNAIFTDGNSEGLMWTKINDHEIHLNEEFMKAEEAAKLAEEHRIKLLENAKIGFGYHISSNEVTPADLHVLFTQAGHAAASSGIGKINVNVVISTELINA